tara:strand:- start:686 stop:1090 length:405 start_codon:yes stop_codon:yes gene_type:complete
MNNKENKIEFEINLKFKMNDYRLKLTSKKAWVISIVLIALILTITAITTGCATNNRHKKTALKIIKNNNAILKEIKKERSRDTIKPLIKKSPKLANAEKRLMMAINAVIESNETVKTEFKTRHRKEVLNEHRER